MISLLWDAGLIDAAIEVETPPSRSRRLTEVCYAHTQVSGVPPEAE
jgi:hypothetical protein